MEPKIQGMNGLSQRVARFASVWLSKSSRSFQIASATWGKLSGCARRTGERVRRCLRLAIVVAWTVLQNGPLGLFALLKSRRVVFGPFLGEVGIELLYWAPTVNFITAFMPRFIHCEIMSRGGMHDWYVPRTNSHYREIYSLRTIDEIEAERVRRVAEFGLMKQVRLSEFEKNLIADSFGRRRVFLVHPSLILFLYRRYWQGKVGLEKVLPSLTYAKPTLSDLPFDLPQSFTAVRFYERDSFRLPLNEVEFENQLGWALEGRLVSVDTGVRYDDHVPLEVGKSSILYPLHGWPADKNLHFQSQAVLRASKLVVTHGGIAYIGVLAGVDTVALETGPTCFPYFHTALALHLARERGVSFSIVNPGWRL